MNDDKDDDEEEMDHGKMMKDYRKRFFISMVLTVPVLISSPTIQNWTGLSPGIPYGGSIILIPASAIFILGGYPFLKGSFREFREKEIGMMTLIALAITVAFGYSMAVTLGLEGKVFYWELATLVDVMLLGHWIEMRSVMGATNSLEELAELIPETAHLVIEGGKVKEVEVEKLNQGDIIKVKPGENIPLDGTIVEGGGSIDESMLTGESVPVVKKENDEVIGGSVNGDSSFKMKIENVKDDSYLSNVMEMVKSSQKERSKTQSFADKAAKWLTLTAITVGLITFISWFAASGDAAFSVERMATVMVITCPHALGLAIPLVVAVSTSYSAKKGLLIKKRNPFERSGRISKVVFDKTGTLTNGRFSVVNIRSFEEDMNENDVLSMIASLESDSEHPIGNTIIEEAKKKDLDIEMTGDFHNIRGEGISARIDGKEYTVTGKKYLLDKGVDVPGDVEEGNTNVFLSDGKKVLGMISLSDELMDNSKKTVDKLKEMDIECWMLTGDDEKVSERISKELGLDGFFAEVLPHDKSEKIKKLQEGKAAVAMVGDGVNDAPALARSDLGIAIGSGTDIAADTADVVLVDSDPYGVVRTIQFGKRTYSKMVQNLLWATGYNVIAIPLAAGVLFWAGIMISPAVGAGLMSLSTIIVAVNARLLPFEMKGS